MWTSKIQRLHQFSAIYILPLFLILFPTHADALAGIAESTSRFHYNDYTKIERGHPSDLCSGASKWCLGLEREDYRRFKDIDFTFEKINVPTENSLAYIIGQRSTDAFWLVYDLQDERVLIVDNDYGKVIDTWNSLGLAKPVFVNAHNTRELLTETRDSVMSRWSFDLQMWFFYTLILLTPVALLFWFFSRKSKQHYKNNASKTFHIFSYLFLVPVLIVVYVAVSSLVQIILYNW